MTRKLPALLIALVLGAIGTLVLLSYVRSAENRAYAGQETVEVLVVTAPIAKGTPASSIREVGAERVPATVRAADAVASLASLDGKVTAVDLVPGEQVVASRFVDPDELARSGDVDLPEGMQLVTISLPPTQSLGGELRPANRVGVWVSIEHDHRDDPDTGEEGEGEAPDPTPSDQTTHQILHQVLVTNVQGEPQPTPAEDAIDPATGRPAAPEKSLFVTLAVTADQAGTLIFAAEYGSIWLSLQPDDLTDQGDRVETMETIYP